MMPFLFFGGGGNHTISQASCVCPAHGVALQLTSLVFVVHVGLSGAATIRVGKAFGQNDAVTLRQGAIAGFVLSMVFAAVTVFAFVLMPKPLLSAFVDANDPDFDQIILYGSVLLLMAAMFQVVDAAQVMALGFCAEYKTPRCRWPWPWSVTGSSDCPAPMFFVLCSTGAAPVFGLAWRFALRPQR